MKHKILYIFILIFSLGAGFPVWPLNEPVSPMTFKVVTFEELPGWGDTSIKESLLAFQISCTGFLRQDPEHAVGSKEIPLKVKDWYPACNNALTLNPHNIDESEAREFFEKWFTPIEFYNKNPVQGLFTGYYLPLLNGSLTETKEYNIPIYGLPYNMVIAKLEDFDPKLAHQHIAGRVQENKLVPFYTREEINNGALIGKAPILAWVNNRIDRLFLEIQGSGIIKLPDGSTLYVGYAGENGAPYTSIAQVLIDKGVMTKDNASMEGIRAYLDAHPQEMLPILNQNKSFVFFRILKQTAAIGAGDVNLTPGYSLAVDEKWIPLGTPLWLDTTRPSQTSTSDKTLQRLMIAQDTGGAIRGPVRGDVFWGAGDKATYIAGHMKNKGYYWLLLPKNVISTLPKQLP
ncbi:Membrane-bound lytic murein transglycosylase [Legionella busanensis]|uniref:Membrane-bound lytic murein transglycosylase A n=1 Tax=Legionella busanensis TaxID=190655 RepID=A0A378KAH1_9GAMM|nr:MltA domain-containing protein [Legionella busanensis]STX81330.1 Membrane-bound lytic murein transglycosylase [Legionella busanensis]